jgi:hypothetical protein
MRLADDPRPLPSPRQSKDPANSRKPITVTTKDRGPQRAKRWWACQREARREEARAA